MATPHDKEGLLQEPLSRFSQPAATPGRCQYCGGLVQAQGRRKKRFCRDLCRTRYHHALRRARLGQLQERLAEAEAVIEQAQALSTPGENCSFVAPENCTPSDAGDEPQTVVSSFRARRFDVVGALVLCGLIARSRSVCSRIR